VVEARKVNPIRPKVRVVGVAGRSEEAINLLTSRSDDMDTNSWTHWLSVLSMILRPIVGDLRGVYSDEIPSRRCESQNSIPILERFAAFSWPKTEDVWG
jgi:hypothetical protein